MKSVLKFWNRFRCLFSNGILFSNGKFTKAALGHHRRIRKYLSLEKAKILGNAFIDSQFNYAPLIWMFCRKELYFKMQKTYHKTLKVIYQYNKTYAELLELSETVSIHQRYLRFLVTKIYKSTSSLFPKFMSSFFTHKEIPYNLREGQVLSLPPTRSTYYGTNSVHFRGSLIWNNLPNYIKSNRSVYEFKNNIKNLRDIDCGCLVHFYYYCFCFLVYYIQWLVLLVMSCFNVPTLNKVINKQWHLFSAH